MARMTFLNLFFACLVLISLNLTRAEIIPYVHHILGPQRPEYLQIAKYAAHDAPHWKPGHGHSFIDLSNLRIRAMCLSDSNPDGGTITEHLSQNCDKTTFNLLMIQEPNEKYWMDYWPDRQFCCTQAMVDSGSCLPEQLDSLLLSPEIPNAFMRSLDLSPNREIRLHDNGGVANYPISSSGLYILIMILCEPNASPVTIQGSVESLDPYGYLPADQFGNLPFYGALSIIYVLLGMGWLGVCCLNKSQILPLQIWITVVIAMGMIETTTLFAHYLQWNEKGMPLVALTVLGLVFGVSKRALSR